MKAAKDACAFRGLLVECFAVSAFLNKRKGSLAVRATRQFSRWRWASRESFNERKSREIGDSAKRLECRDFRLPIAAFVEVNRRFRDVKPTARCFSHHSQKERVTA